MKEERNAWKREREKNRMNVSLPTRMFSLLSKHRHIRVSDRKKEGKRERERERKSKRKKKREAAIKRWYAVHKLLHFNSTQISI